jgi:hypothetical protein
VRLFPTMEVLSSGLGKVDYIELISDSDLPAQLIGGASYS